MEVWYEAYLCKIKKVNVVKETRNFIVLENSANRKAKDSGWRWYRKTFYEARQCLRNQKKNEINNLQHRIDCLKNELGEIWQLKEEDC